MAIRVLYFARIREALGVAEENIDYAELQHKTVVGALTVAMLLDSLRARSGTYAEVLAIGQRYRVALNQDVAALSDVVQDGDEVAIFPPVTGG
jgi:sulfur-carrier protein